MVTIPRGAGRLRFSPALARIVCGDSPPINRNLKIKKTVHIAPSFYFSRFSKVEDARLVRWTREKPYSAVKTKLFGRSSQGITNPSFSALLKNSLVRLEVLVLSISKIPIIELSRTAISFPMDRYIGYLFSIAFLLCVIARALAPVAISWYYFAFLLYNNRIKIFPIRI